MARGTKQKISVVFLPPPARPAAAVDRLPPLPWFRLPKSCYLHMLVNPAHVRDPDDEKEIAVRTVTARRTTEDAHDRHVLIEEPPLDVEDDAQSVRSGYTSDAGFAESDGDALDFAQPPVLALPPPPAAPTSARPPLISKSERHSHPHSRKRARSPADEEVIDVDDEADRAKWRHRLRAANQNGLLELPRDLEDAPLSQLRRVYAANRRCVQIDSLVKGYSAALLMCFVAVDVVSENLVGVDMDRYVDLQLKQMQVYRYHLHRLAERQVATARSTGLFSENQSPVVSIFVTFTMTTVCFFAVKIFMKNKGPGVINMLGQLFGTPVSTAEPAAAAPSFNPLTSVMSMLAPSGPQRRMPRPGDMAM